MRAHPMAHFWPISVRPIPRPTQRTVAGSYELHSWKIWGGKRPDWPTNRDRAPSPPLPCPCLILPPFSSPLTIPLPFLPSSCSSLQLLSRGGVHRAIALASGHRTHILALTLTTKITTVTSVRRRDETKRLNVYARLDFLNSRKQLSCEFN